MIIVNSAIVKRAILVLLIVLTVGFIWSNSLADGTESTERSDAVIDLVKPLMDPGDRIGAELFELLIRKTAHFTEFAVLGAEVYALFTTFERFRRPGLCGIVFPAGCAFLCAVTDELLQLTSAGRDCNVVDMMIDLGGILTGIGILCLVRWIVSRKKRNT